MKFIGFALLEMTKATGTEDIRTARTYDITVYDKFGRVQNENLKLNEIEREWGKMRMTGDRFAVLDGSTVSVLSAEEFEAKKLEWFTRRADLSKSA